MAAVLTVSFLIPLGFRMKTMWQSASEDPLRRRPPKSRTIPEAVPEGPPPAGRIQASGRAGSVFAHRASGKTKEG
jgi:hypothetical protein